MNECMFAGRREQRHAQSERALPSRGTPQRTQPSRAHYSASVPNRRTLQRIGVEHDGEGPVVYKLHLHVRAKRSRGNARDILTCQLH